MADGEAGGRRERILQIARELFAKQGYAGTSIADISSKLGTSKAALYYHFSSKEDILGAILEKPLDAYAKLAAFAATRPVAEELIGAVIDVTADEGADFAIFANDPSIMAVLSEQAARHDLISKIMEIVAALAGPDADPVRLVLARAAFSAAKDGATAALVTQGGVLLPETREALLHATARMLAVPESSTVS